MAYVWCPRPMMLQALIFPKSTFDAVEAFEWLGHYGYAPKKVEETGRSFRARLYPPTAFVKGSFRTISMGRGSSAVRAVVGCPLPRTFQKEATRRARLVASRKAAKKRLKKVRH